MTCDLCADPPAGRAIVLCPACQPTDPADRHRTMRAALDRREALRTAPTNRRGREGRTRARTAGVCQYGPCTAPSPGRTYCRTHARMFSLAAMASARRAKARGDCAICLTARAAPGHVCCARCRARSRGYMARLKARRLAAGVCVRCAGPPARPAVRYCADCLAAAAEGRAALRAARHQAGRCVRCGGARDGEPLTCTPCRLRENAARRRETARRREAARVCAAPGCSVSLAGRAARCRTCSRACRARLDRASRRARSDDAASA